LTNIIAAYKSIPSPRPVPQTVFNDAVYASYLFYLFICYLALSESFSWQRRFTDFSELDSEVTTIVLWNILIQSRHLSFLFMCAVWRNF